MNKVDALAEKILDLINANLKERHEEFKFITLDQTDEDLQQLGMDSITFIRIVVALEETFGIEIPDEKLFIAEMGTLNRILEVVLTATEPISEQGESV